MLNLYAWEYTFVPHVCRNPGDKLEEDIVSLGTGVAGDCEPHCEGWELNPSSTS